MDALFQWMKENAGKSIGIPAFLSSINFLGNLFLALSDGVLTQQEFHALLTSANGIETIILLIAWAAFREKKDKK